MRVTGFIIQPYRLIRQISISGLQAGVIIMPLLVLSNASADVDIPTKFSNQGSIANTRHNLTQRTIGPGYIAMNAYRNNYNEVCVYCHTPHGASTVVKAPLWNRTASSATYKTYDELNTSSLVGTVSNPGVNSVTCLSCHDGTLGVDSIINMPGSGKYSKAQETSQSDSFLNDNWTNTEGADARTHMGIATGECMACHDPNVGGIGSGATDFNAFAIGTDLTNDHPVGITFPVQFQGKTFNTLDFQEPQIAAFDTDNNAILSKGDVRVYDTGDGYEVECASCHDPHGIPSAGTGSTFFPSFLRTTNDESRVCLSCHIK